jgi:hypothetical protein
MKNKIDKSLILSRIKSHYGIKKDGDFAVFLNISQATLSNWHSRNTFDAELIISKCENIDANWLLTGKGEMLKSHNVVSSHVSEPEGYYETSNPSKDLLIETQQKLIKSLEEQIDSLKLKLAEFAEARKAG